MLMEEINQLIKQYGGSFTGQYDYEKAQWAVTLNVGHGVDDGLAPRSFSTKNSDLMSALNDVSTAAFEKYSNITRQANE